jgi:3-dehydroquinate dehydratase-1
VRIGRLELGAIPAIAVAMTDADLAGASSWAPLADVVELRVDLCADLSVAGAVSTAQRVATLGKPLLITVRSASEGGGGGLDDDARLALFEALAPLADGLDVELASPLCEGVVGLARRHGRLAIVSSHDFACTPPDGVLAARLRDAAQRGDVAKLAATANDRADLLRLLDALRNAPSPAIVIGMGAYGSASRLFFPLLGSLLTYSFAGAPTAPGQLALPELYDALRAHAPDFAATHAAR